jgi:arylesterase/paraoxonase
MGAILGFILAIFVFLNTNPLYSASPKSCTPIYGAMGPEDVEIDQESGFAFISSLDRSAPVAIGNIYKLDMNSKSSALTAMTIVKSLSSLKDFHPHGISLYREEGKLYLFAVNHIDATHTQVDGFEVSNNNLVHIGSVYSPLIQNANDLHVVSLWNFYISVDHGNAPMWAKVLYDLVWLKNGRVYHYDSKSFTKVGEKIVYPNGVISTKSNSTLYIASTVSNSLFVYKNDTVSKSWKLIQRKKLPGMPDNLSWDANKNLIVSVHPSRLRFARHTLDHSYLAGSRVLRLKPLKDGRLNKIENIFEDATGTLISGSSGAALYNNEIIIGAVFDDHVLRCTY